jgi:hypothetical protein
VPAQIEILPVVSPDRQKSEEPHFWQKPYAASGTGENHRRFESASSILRSATSAAVAAM